jgi:hypothetical protein
MSAGERHRSRQRYYFPPFFFGFSVAQLALQVDATEHSEAITALEELIKGYIEDCQRYIHGHSTIQLESLNGSAAKRVDKQRNWTVMYESLFNAGILERNEGTYYFLIFIFIFIFIISV